MVAPGHGEFRVNTPAGQVLVLGTEFEIALGAPGEPDSDDRVALVSVRRGIVQAIGGGYALRLVAGERALMVAGKPPVRQLPSFAAPQPATPLPPPRLVGSSGNAPPSAASGARGPAGSAGANDTASAVGAAPGKSELVPGGVAVVAGGAAVGGAGGIIRGIVELQNAPATSPPGISCIRDPETTGANGPATNAIVRLTSVPPAPTARSFPPHIRVTVEGCSVTPRVSVARVSQGFDIINGDGLLHSVRVYRDDFDLKYEVETGRTRVGWGPGGIETQNLGPKRRGTSPQSLMNPGLYALACDTRPGECGYVAVTDHPYFALTGPSGRFTIEGVPAGHHTINAWHERTGSKAVEVNVVDGFATEVKIVLGGKGPPEPPVIVARSNGDKCEIAVSGDSPIVTACKEGGMLYAKKAMKDLVKRGKSAGVKFECDDCHKSDRSYQLTATARENFKKLLAVTAAK